MTGIHLKVELIKNKAENSRLTPIRQKVIRK